jgi:hypothetical protein
MEFRVDAFWLPLCFLAAIFASSTCHDVHDASHHRRAANVGAAKAQRAG